MNQKAGTSNYDLMRDAMELEFAKYDHMAIAEKLNLMCDADYLYIRFVGREYRIDRKNGRTEWFCHNMQAYVHADYSESMTIFDMLTYSKEKCELSGQFVVSSELPGTVKSASANASIFSGHNKYFTGRGDALRRACIQLGGQPQNVGDVSFIIPMFDFFPVMVQFWDADEEFDAVLKFMWDRNATAFMHFESIAFATGHLISRLKECMER